MVAIQKAKTKFTKLHLLLLLIFLLFLDGSAFFVASEIFVIVVFLVLLAIFLYKRNLLISNSLLYWQSGSRSI